MKPKAGNHLPSPPGPCPVSAACRHTRGLHVESLMEKFTLGSFFFLQQIFLCLSLSPSPCLSLSLFLCLFSLPVSVCGALTIQWCRRPPRCVWARARARARVCVRVGVSECELCVCAYVAKFHFSVWFLPGEHWGGGQARSASLPAWLAACLAGWLAGLSCRDKYQCHPKRKLLEPSSSYSSSSSFFFSFSFSSYSSFSFSSSSFFSFV